MRPTAIAAAGALLGAGIGLVVVGCAVGEKSDIFVDLEPNEPRVDAAYEPQPANPMPAPTPDPDPDVDPDPGEGSSGGTPVGTPDAGGSSSGSSGTSSGQTPLSGPKPTQGEVIISEILYDPSTPEPNTEWIEVYNRTTSPRTLTGLTLVDGSGRNHVIGGNVVLAGGAYGLLVRNASGAQSAKVPSSVVVYVYGAGLDEGSGVLLTNGNTGKVALRDGTTVIADVPYGGWFSSVSGRSIQLKALHFAGGQNKSNWCVSATAWATGSDRGTPGAAHDCP